MGYSILGVYIGVPLFRETTLTAWIDVRKACGQISSRLNRRAIAKQIHPDLMLELSLMKIACAKFEAKCPTCAGVDPTT